MKEGEIEPLSELYRNIFANRFSRKARRMYEGFLFRERGLSKEPEAIGGIDFCEISRGEKTRNVGVTITATSVAQSLITWNYYS